MMFTNHLVVSLTSWYVVSSQTDWVGEFQPFSLGLVALGTALPDVDHPGSTIGRKVKWLSWPINQLFGHRNITHSLIAIVAAAWLASQFSLLVPLAFGYALHLLGDFVTPAGLKLFWPVPKVFRSPVTIPTNSIIEYALVWSAAGFIIAYFEQGAWYG